ncbi:uncharacterized protein FPRN_13198 [Fusarium proliferatum]|nr:uncharacterized protein FPRN_13198 [Fusarium proliferatum]
MKDIKTDYKKNFSLAKDNERPREGQETEVTDLVPTAQDFESHAIQGMKPRASKNVKSNAILSTLKDILKDPPFAQISQTHKDEVHYTLPVLDPGHKYAVEKAEATVVGFFEGEDVSGRIRRNRLMKDIVYGSGPTEVMETAIRNLINIDEMARRQSIHFNSKLYAKENFKLTWVHLPSTNMIWMNDLLTKVMSHEHYPIREYYELRSFFRDSWVQVPDEESRSRMMRPRYVARPMKETDDGSSGKTKTPDPTKDTVGVKENTGSASETAEKNKKETTEAQSTATDPVEDKRRVDDDQQSDSSQFVERSHGVVASAVYMPYLDYSAHCRHWDTESPDLQQAYQHYEELLKSYQGNDKPQHGSPTLDEWNESQVVSKYLQESPKVKDSSGTKDRNQWTVVRVNQPWIWTISTDWIITATSLPFTSSPDTLVEEILNQLDKQAEYGSSRAQPESTSDLVPVIIDHCIGLYEKRPNDAGRISIGQTFSHYINGITTLFDRFRALSSGEHRRKKAKDKKDSHFRTVDSKQAHNEHITVPAPATAISTNGQPIETTELSRSPDTSAAIQQAKNLYCDIKDVRDELSILRSVAQYQQIVQKGFAEKGVDESRFSSSYVIKDLKELDSIAERIQSAINTTLSLQQSDLANRQATEATEQGKTVMTFTFATVIFLPLSFLSSLFALDVASFQEAPAWAFYTIFFVSLGISGLLGSSAVYWENIMHFKDQFMASPTHAIKELFRSTSTPSTIPTSSDSGDNETGGATKHRRIISKIKDRSQVLTKRFKWRKKENDIDHIAV